ncbi:MAG: hypothetical protein CSA76_01050, partial [Spirochaetales bacterium]
MQAVSTQAACRMSSVRLRQESARPFLFRSFPLWAALLAAVSALLLGSCRSVPPAEEVPLSAYMLPEAETFAGLNVKDNQDMAADILSRSGIKTARIDEILKRTSRVVVSLEAPRSEAALSAAPSGAS